MAEPAEEPEAAAELAEATLATLAALLDALAAADAAEALSRVEAAIAEADACHRQSPLVSQICCIHAACKLWHCMHWPLIVDGLSAVCDWSLPTLHCQSALISAAHTWGARHIEVKIWSENGMQYSCDQCMLHMPCACNIAGRVRHSASAPHTCWLAAKADAEAEPSPARSAV